MNGTTHIVAESKTRGPRRRRAGQRGSAAVELAILSPLLFLVTIGAFELGRGMWVKHTLSHVASEGARYAAVRSVTSDDPATKESIAGRVKSEAVGVNPADLVVETTWDPSNTVGGTVQVRVLYEFHPVTPLIPFKTLELASTSKTTIAY